MSDDQQVEVLREDIEQTREDMSQTIDQLEQRLSPDALQEQATEMIRQLSDQLLSEFQSKSDEVTSKITEQFQTAINSAASSKADQLLGQAGTAVKGAGTELWSRLAQNPAPVALAAIGIGLLAAEGGNAKQQISQMAQGLTSQGAGQGEGQGGGQGLLETASSIVGEQVAGAKERLGGVAEQATEKVQGVKGQAAETVQGAIGQAKEQGQHLMGGNGQNMSGSANGSSGQQGSPLSGLFENPGFATGLLALGIGLVAGLGVPETQREQQLAAPLREKATSMLDQMGVTDSSGQGEGLIDQVKQTGTELLEEAKSTATETASQVSETAASLKSSVTDAAAQSTGKSHSSSH